MRRSPLLVVEKLRKDAGCGIAGVGGVGWVSVVAGACTWLVESSGGVMGTVGLVGLEVSGAGAWASCLL